MAGLSVIFKAIDEISDKLDAMSSAGNKTLDAFDKLSDTADKAFANTTEETQKATEAMERRRRQPITGRMQLAIMIRAVWKRFIQQKNL